MIRTFVAENTTIATTERHDLYRCQLMVGHDVDAEGIVRVVND
jgi:hypothetical protein